MALKINQADYDRLKAAIDKVTAARPGMYNLYKQQGLSDMRYNWDVLRLSGFDVCSLYHYLNDDHINSALKTILGNTGLSSKQE